MVQADNRPIILLDGATGTELIRSGIFCPEPAWSAHAVRHHPRAVLELHRRYVQAGAQVLTAATFRATPRAVGAGWEQVATAAVRLAREAAESCPSNLPADASLQRFVPPRRPPWIAGSIAPIEDCYRPDLSPARRDPVGTRRHFAVLARVLAQAGCDLLLCETFAHAEEAAMAVEQAADTDLPVWCALTAGPLADLMSPAQMSAAAGTVLAAGASAVLVNCTPAPQTLAYLEAVRQVIGGAVPLGAYANAGNPADRLGWTDQAEAARRYADLAATWPKAGATIIGGCCGTTPAHIAELARRFTTPPCPCTR